MSKKTIEIPEDVARAYLRGEGSIAAVRSALRDALIPSRDEALGLPWRHEGSALIVVGAEYGDSILASSAEQARFIAKAPEMAALLETVLSGDFLWANLKEDLRSVLKESGWLENA